MRPCQGRSRGFNSRLPLHKFFEPRSTRRSTKYSKSVFLRAPSCPSRFVFYEFYEARYPSGKGEVCKTFMRRFDSDPRLHSNPRIKSSGVTPVTDFVKNGGLALPVDARTCCRDESLELPDRLQSTIRLIAIGHDGSGFTCLVSASRICSRR